MYRLVQVNLICCYSNVHPKCMYTAMYICKYACADICDNIRISYVALNKENEIMFERIRQLSIPHRPPPTVATVNHNNVQVCITDIEMIQSHVMCIRTCSMYQRHTSAGDCLLLICYKHMMIYCVTWPTILNVLLSVVRTCVHCSYITVCRALPSPIFKQKIQ